MGTNKDCIAMLLAGGQGSRLGVLTRHRAKPAVPYGGKYRIIDFPLSNCANSGIDVVGVLTQYEPFILNSYIGTGAPWDLDTMSGGVFVLSPYTQAGDIGRWFEGTADAIYQNAYFVDRFDPAYIAVLSGDHIYKMDYAAMLDFHKANNADATIAVMQVPIEEASRFGILETNKQDQVTAFVEKPKEPKSDLASMGVYIFTWQKVKEYLIADAANPSSSHDFGKDVIPAMLNSGARLFAYRFSGYWRDVDTVESLWQANMDLLGANPELDLSTGSWKIYSRNPNMSAAHIGEGAQLRSCMVAEGCEISGTIEHSVLFQGVTVEEGAVVRDSVIMSGCTIKRGAVLERAVLAESVEVGAGATIGATPKDALVVVGAEAVIDPGAAIAPGTSVEPGAHVTEAV